MALSDLEYQLDILSDIGDDGTVAPGIETLWAKHSARGFMSKELQALFVKVDALGKLLASVRGRYSFKSKDAVDNLNELTGNLREMRSEAIRERDLLLKRLTSGGPPAVGVLTATATTTTPAGYPDANSDYYRGVPGKFGAPVSKG